MLVTAVTCLKHEGFHEEREWRVIYSPMRFPSSLIEASTEIIAGVPQLLYKLPLDEAVSPVLDDPCLISKRVPKGTTKRLLANQEAFKHDPTIKLWAEDLLPMYTVEELEIHIENVSKLKEEFEIASYGVLPRLSR